MDFTKMAPILTDLMNAMQRPPEFIAVNWVGNPAWNAGMGIPYPENGVPDTDDDLFPVNVSRILRVDEIDGVIVHHLGAVIHFHGCAIIVEEKYSDLVKWVNPPRAA